MLIYSKNYFNDPYYDLVMQGDPTFFGQFRIEGERRYCVIENNQIVIKDDVFYRKPTSYNRWIIEARKPKNEKPFELMQIKTKLSGNKETKKRTNADLREFIFFKDYYLTNKHFTLGLQTVPEDTCHVFCSTHKELIFYTPKPPEISLDKPFDELFRDKPNGFFDESYQVYFLKSILEAGQTVIFCPREKYIMVSPSKCIFYFKEMKNLIFQSPEKTLENSILEQTLKNSIFHSSCEDYAMSILS